VLSSSVSSDESVIDANSNDDAIDGQQVVLYLSGLFLLSTTTTKNVQITVLPSVHHTVVEALYKVYMLN